MMQLALLLQWVWRWLRNDPREDARRRKRLNRRRRHGNRPGQMTRHHRMIRSQRHRIYYPRW